LPREISPTPLFKQLEKIQGAKKEVDEKLNSLKDVNIDQRLVPLKTFQKFAEYSKFILEENPDFNVRRKILQKFVRRVEIGPDSVKIYWNVDKEFYSNEVVIGSNKEKSQAKACDSLKDQNNLKNVGYVGSNSFTIGASGETRTRNKLHRKWLPANRNHRRLAHYLPRCTRFCTRLCV
jgi:hypothetical protein